MTEMQVGKVHIDELIELAPETAYRKCSFHDCEFVGVGPVVFINCAFVNCLPDVPQSRIRGGTIDGQKWEEK